MQNALDWYRPPSILFTLLVALLVCPRPAPACTSVCLTKGGHVVFGNNLDWFIDDGLVVINKRHVIKHALTGSRPAQWTSRYASVTINQSGNGFPDRGMNEAGLVIGEMWLGSTEYPDRDARPTVDGSHWMQYQLDTCATVQEVLATDKVLRIDKDEYKSHFFICDASGTCATVEWFEGKLRACSGDAVKIKAMANSPYAECLTKGDDPSGRFGKAARMLDGYSGGDPVAHVFSILHAVRQNHTVWSLVFDVQDRRLYYRTARNPEIRSVSLKDFDPSCDSPVQLLDVNAPGKGDVRADFKAFTPEENARVTRATLEKWKARHPDFSDQDMNKTLDYYKTMQCQPDPARETKIPTTSPAPGR